MVRTLEKSPSQHVDTAADSFARLSMLGASEFLRENLPLRRLLEHYRWTRQSHPDQEWSDRLMQFASVGESELSRLHGLLLAHGWLDTRVDRASFDVPGEVRSCYRLTREGNQALRSVEDVFDLEPEGEPTILDDA